jgi:GDPmannose 4,6-dehydratase
MKKALVTGITGQDGAYLSKLLVEKGYEVYGAYRRSSETNFNRIRFLGIEDQIKYVPMELLEFTNIHTTLEKIQPDEIYNLGAQSSVPASFEEPIFTAEVTGMGILRILEAVRAINQKIKVYQASSSEMFGKVRESPQTEATAFHPRSPYAVAKIFAHWAAVNYRESYGLFVCSGILFNHESPLRGSEFVTRKITQSIARFKIGLQNEVGLGNLNSSRDWGYAPEYVEAMWMMMQQADPDDYVVATGETHSVREFTQIAFEKIGVGLEWSGQGLNERGINKANGTTIVKVDPQFFRPADADYLVGDYSRAKEKLGWSPKTNFKELVGIMVEHDLSFAKGNHPS